jgi:hypothetical protein
LSLKKFLSPKKRKSSIVRNCSPSIKVKIAQVEKVAINIPGRSGKTLFMFKLLL